MAEIPAVDLVATTAQELRDFLAERRVVFRDKNPSQSVSAPGKKAPIRQIVTGHRKA
ncbi:MAG: hypothetical protein ACREDF_07370 [Thermoplasmata archaeon]